MAKSKTENTKKVAANQNKAKAAAEKQEAADAKKAQVETDEWSKGEKSTKKADVAASRRAEAAKRKAEREALLAEEEKEQPTKPKNAGAKSNPKKSRGLDLSALDDTLSDPKAPASTLNATGIDNALDALSLTSNTTQQIDRHPERRYKAALAAYEARRLPELDEEMKGLRRNQKVEIIKKEFERSEENPYNQVHVPFDAGQDEIEAAKKAEREKVEGRLAEK